MFMKKLAEYQGTIVALLLPILCAMLLREPAHAQGAASDTAGVKNVKWSINNDVVTINYDLAGSPGDKFAVRIIMKKENDPSVNVVPKAVEGDIGEGFFAGTNREIRWYFRNELPQGLAGEGYFFEIHTQVVGSETNWMYYALGAAVAGGVVALIVGKNSGSGPPPAVELPLPPGRPQ
jgi:hypothetical protein